MYLLTWEVSVRNVGLRKSGGARFPRVVHAKFSQGLGLP